MSPEINKIADSITNLPGAPFEKNFPVGEPAQMEFNGKKFNTVIRAVQASKHILVDIPIVNGKPITFVYNTSFTVRFFVSGAAYGFTAFPIRLHPKHALLVLEYPEFIKKYSLRTSDRITIFVPVKVIIKGNPEKLTGAILDISSQGASISLNQTEGVKTGLPVKISFVLPNGKQVKSIQGVIMAVTASGKKITLGINFNEKDKATMTTVTTFHKNCLTYMEDSKDSATNEPTEMFGLNQALTIEIGRKKVETFLRGWKKGERGFIIVDPPSLEQMPGDLKPGMDAVVRMVKCGSLWGLEANFFTVLEKTNLWILEFHGDVVKFPLRSDERIYCMVPVVIAKEKDGKKVEINRGMLSSLSMGGVKLLTHKSHIEEETVWISFSLGTIGSVQFQKLKVLRYERRDSLYQYAGSFLNISTENKEKLTQFFDFSKNWLVELQD